MAFNNKGLRATLIGAMIALATALPAAAIDFTNVAYIQTSTKATSIPVGHLEFCERQPAECRPNANVVPAVSLTDKSWNELVSVNAYYNQTVVPVTDKELYQVDEFWTFPNGYGDCEDFALAKRRDLIKAGWPASTLMVAVVKEANGDGHAVLMARTDRGDLVLDNQDGAIRLWSETPYKFIKRQSQANPGEWVDMFDDRVTVVAARAN